MYKTKLIFYESNSNLFLIDTIITNPEIGWIQYINAINVIPLGNQTLLLQGLNQYDADGTLIDGDTAIANISFNLSMPYAPPIIYEPPAPATPIKLVCNQFKSTNRNGYITLSYYIIDGVTTIGQLSSTRDILVNWNYLLQDISTLSGLLK